MEKTFFKQFKKILCSGLFCAGVNYNFDSSIIRKHDLEYHVRQTAEQFLTNEGFGASYIPARLQSDYEQKLQAVKQELLTLLAREGRSYLEVPEVQETLRRVMRPFADNLRSIVHDYHLRDALTRAIQSYLASKGLTQDSIPDRDVPEFINRSSTVMDKLQTIMRNDKRSYVRVFEVEKEIDNALNVFVRRIANALSYGHNGLANNNQNIITGLDWVAQFFNAIQQPKPTVITTTAETTTQAAKIMDYELEQSVTNVAWNVLRAHNVDPNKIPARADLEYREKIQRSLRLLRDLMLQAGRTYVWKHELEQLMLAELQSVVDKIHFKGESCAICLDDYAKGQRIGIVSCGHHYHSDCIYSWFKQQTTCPICRAQNVILAQIETMA